MKFDVLTLQYIHKKQSPTDELLNLWGIQNHTVLELFVLLSRMQHYQAMTVLKPLGKYCVCDTLSLPALHFLHYS